MDRNMLIRGITGAIFVGLVVLAVLFSFVSMSLFFFIVSVIGLYEFYQLKKTSSPGLQLWVILLSGIFTFGMVLLKSEVLIIKYHFLDPLYLLLPLLILVPVLTDLFSKTQTNFSNTSNSIFASLYISLPFGLLSHLSFYEDGIYNGELILSFFILIWANDTFAYLTGKLMGRNKLWERISPKKTWEGFIGGLVFCTLTFFIILTITDREIEPLSALIPIAIGTFATLGDLSESLLKRQAGVKDSGTILPGHGGVLDRFDGIFLSVPVIFLIIQLSDFF